MKQMGNHASGSISSVTGDLDTTFVLFFLALEYGRSASALSIDGFFMGITMIMVLILPYFLPSRFERPRMSEWMLYRGTVALAGLGLGVLMSFSIGGLLPEGTRFMPMTFLILASMISCYIRFYSLMKLRPVK